VLILTRPAAAARRFRAELGDPGLPMIESPALSIRPLPVSRPPGDWAGLILTSENGAAAALRMGFAPGTPVWAVGERTAQAATGLAATAAAGDAESLIALILSRRPAGPLLHIRGEHARGDIAARLTAAGIATAEITAYAQEALPLSPAALAALAGNDPVILPLFSPRSGAIILSQGPFAAPLHVAAISAAAAGPFQGVATSVTVAAEPGLAAMVDATNAAIRRAHAG
jgi:uroporphyrinogen-III synthase